VFFSYNESMSIAHNLVEWYRVHQRDLPFRQNRDPYRVWISEMMAQQTQIDTLIPYFLRWMDRFPTLSAVAEASEADVLVAWQGLGYYARARNIHKAAQHILREHKGVFPSTLNDLKALPGVGPYSAAAIASICFDLPAVAIDGNVKRVMSRLFRLDEQLIKKSFSEALERTVQDWMHDHPPHIVTQAIMELGALVCTKQAKCQKCPLQAHCEAYQHNEVSRYPKVRPKNSKPKEIIEVVCVRDAYGRIALTLHHSDQLMKGMYRLPTLTQVTTLDQLRFIEQRTHVFSHKIWEVRFHYACTQNDHSDLVWVDLDALKDYPIITVHRKWLEEEALTKRFKRT
jgi:A/G-specific adenine glycosylase